MDNKKVKTKNVGEVVGKYAAEKLLKPSQYDFSIVGIDTYIKTVTNPEYILYKDDVHNYYADKSKLINEHVEFKQLYYIHIKSPVKKIIDLKYSLKYSNNKIVAFILLDPASKIPYKEFKAKEIYTLLIKEFNKIKAKNKILVNIFDESMREKLKSFTKHLYLGKFKKTIKLPLFEGVEPEIAVNSKLIKHFLRKPSKHQLIEVEPQELLVEYIKPKFGNNGLNAHGTRVSNNYEKNVDDIKAHVDLQTIQIVEDEDKKLYKSKIRGFVQYTEKKFLVDNQIKMKSLSRVHDSVAKDEDNNIKVVVAQHDTSTDSIGEGVKLKSESIHITGHVGAKSKLQAANLVIDGATHNSSIQEAKFAEINRHKGTLRCHKAKIKLLEGGMVHATDVEIEASLGGSVYAENVIIGLVKSNLKVYASKSITIRLVTGEDNLFKINYKDIPTLNSKREYINHEIDELKEELEGALKHTQSQVPILKTKIKELKEKEDEIINSTLHAKITIKEPLMGLNTITFTIDDEHELTYKTDARLYKEFYLKQIGNQITLIPTDKSIKLDN